MTVGTAALESANILARCVVNFFYTLAATILRMLQTLVTTLIALIDAKILELQAMIAQLDIWNSLVEFVWSLLEGILDELKNTLLGAVQKIGPPMALCPEFYNYFVSPVIALIDSLSFFRTYKEKFQTSISVLAYFNKLLTYWETTKATLVACNVVIEDALYQRMSVEGLGA